MEKIKVIKGENNNIHISQELKDKLIYRIGEKLGKYRQTYHYKGDIIGCPKNPVVRYKLRDDELEIHLYECYDSYILGLAESMGIVKREEHVIVDYFLK